ncbi:MAG: hypothetical protein IPJ07_10975 [Acidobacteria bacterium]|nr:hypothetical protein [Acidobacteriota bacterium]
MTIDLKDLPMNVITRQFLEDLAASVEKVKRSGGQRAILTSGKPSFMAGAGFEGCQRAVSARCRGVVQNGDEFCRAF